ncbi:MAG: hypothetical protein KJO42_07555 [Silicimonas sp.]|nr:hypothetical protein [Silicimonas sp.]
MPQNDFAARLARIEAKKPDPEPVSASDVPADALFDAPEDAVPATPGPDMATLAAPVQGGGGLGLGRMLAWIGLLIGLGAMGATGAILMTDGLPGKAPAGFTAAGSGQAAMPSALVPADGLAPPQTGPAWWEGDQGLTDLFGPQLSSFRNVTVYKRLPVSDLPEGGDLSDLDTFALDHGAAYFEGYCSEMRQVLAADCAGDRFRAKLILDGRYVEVSAEFLFAPSLWTGSAKQVSDGRIHKGALDLTKNGGLPDTPASRAEIYARAVSLCGGLRARYGNCAIEFISIEPAGSADNPQISARAAVHVYASDSGLDRNILQAEIERVTRMRDQALMVLSFL